MSQIGNIFTNIGKGISNTIGQFSQSSSVGISGNAFLEANSLIAKFVFLILVIFSFLFLLSLGIAFFNYLLSPPANPYVIYGMWNGNSPAQIRQDPSKSDSVYIQRSNNQDGGLEFTWSIWLYINDIADYGSTSNMNTIVKEYQHIFNKGNSTFKADGTAQINNCPGIYLQANNDTSSNTPMDGVIRVILDTIEPKDTTGTIDIHNIPLRKWFHMAVRVKNTIADIYINGVIAQRQILTNLPRQNYEDLFLCQNSGFSGSLSNLRYYQYALNVFEINNIISYGPNLNVVNDTTTADYHYLSKNWYYYNQDISPNP